MLERCVLIIDDDRDIGRSLSIRLRAAGYRVQVAHDGATGIEQAARLLPSAALLDLQMSPIDGFEVLTTLKRAGDTAGIPVIVLSANVIERTRSRALSIGAACFVQKPFKAEQVLSALAHFTTVESPAAPPRANRILPSGACGAPGAAAAEGRS